jgi:protoporphyrin/coproporphyrin ferrochelatase
MKSGVLVMSYGTPDGLEDLERYYTDIRRGRPPTPELLQELTERYEAIGGASPLAEITRAQAEGIGERLGVGARVGYKHSPPFIEETVKSMIDEGFDAITGVVMAPHYSTMSIADYRRRTEDAAGSEIQVGFVESWHLEPGYIAWLTNEILSAAGPRGAADRPAVIFTAHSLPVRILEAGDPYPRQLEQTAEAVAGAAGLPRWRIGWQSAGRTSDEWLGPDLLAIVDELADAGEERIVVCPCGFVADHLEVLYDIDIEAAQHARGRGVELTRTPAPNADPSFLDAVSAAVGNALVD